MINDDNPRALLEIVLHLTLAQSRLVSYVASVLIGGLILRGSI